MLPLFNMPEPERSPGLPAGKEIKKRGRPEDIAKKEQRAKATVVESNLIEQVYEHWLQIMRPESKRIPQLDEQRRRKIGWAIYDYGVEACKKAIDGCATSDWHMGRNPQRKRYDSIELIFRDQQKIDMFLSMAEENADEF